MKLFDALNYGSQIIVALTSIRDWLAEAEQGDTLETTGIRRTKVKLRDGSYKDVAVDLKIRVL